MDETNSPYARWLMTGFFWLAAVYGVYLLISTFVVFERTSLLTVSVSNQSAQVSVSAPGKTAAIIGTGNVRARLKPGVYQLVASSAGSRTAKVIKISKKQTSHISLNLNNTSIIRSPANVNYQNMNALINNGLSTSQITALQEYFFQFKPSANTVIVDPGSIEPGARDPNTATSFTLDFNVAVGSAPYKAVATYTNLTAVRLQLLDPHTNAVIFDSDTANSNGGGE